MPILVGIDGTGSNIMSGQRRDEEYDRAFANSFVRKLCEETKPNRKYLRGPLLLGGDLAAWVERPGLPQREHHQMTSLWNQVKTLTDHQLLSHLDNH